MQWNPCDCLLCNVWSLCSYQVWRINRRGNTSCSPPATTSTSPPAPPRDASCPGRTTGGPFWTAEGSEEPLWVLGSGAESFLKRKVKWQTQHPNSWCVGRRGVLLDHEGAPWHCEKTAVSHTTTSPPRSLKPSGKTNGYPAFRLVLHNISSCTNGSLRGPSFSRYHRHGYKRTHSDTSQCF